MKKILSILSVFAVTLAPATAVVSCGENTKNYDEFMGWINSKESFLLYIGADDCDFCKQFDNANDNHGNTLKNILKNTQNHYIDKIVDPEYQNGPFGFGDALNGDITLRTFKGEHHDTVLTEKWAEKIFDWVGDRIWDFTKYFNGEGNFIKDRDEFNKLYKSNIKDKLGTPTFLLIRNGELVDVYTKGFGIGDDQDEENALVKLGDDINSAFVDEDFASHLVTRVINGDENNTEYSLDYSKYLNNWN